MDLIYRYGIKQLGYGIYLEAHKCCCVKVFEQQTSSFR